MFAGEMASTALDMVGGNFAQQMPGLFGWSTDDEAIMTMLETGMEKHYQGEMTYITEVRAALTEEKRKRWRLIVVKIDTTKLEFREPPVLGVKKTPVIIGHGPAPASQPNLMANRRQAAGTKTTSTKGPPIVDYTIEETLGAPIKIEFELTPKDPRIAHLHDVASIVKKHIDKLPIEALRKKRVYDVALKQGVAEAVRHLNLAYLDDTPYIKIICMHIKNAYGWSENQLQAFGDKARNYSATRKVAPVKITNNWVFWPIMTAAVVVIFAAISFTH
jgi:hypothetical protein